MAYYKVKGQARFLENHLRGTSRGITASQAANRYGILNLRARVFDLRDAGLVVSVKGGKYSMVARDISGSRAKVFA